MKANTTLTPLAVVLFLAGCGNNVSTGPDNAGISDAIPVDEITSDTDLDTNDDTDLEGDADTGVDTMVEATCPASPDFCDDGSETFDTDGWFTQVQHAGFRMFNEQVDPESTRLINEIALHPEATIVTIDDVLENLNQPAPRVDRVLSVENMTGAFSWDQHDNSDDTWYPQGITGNRNPSATAQPADHILIASWYHRPENDPETDVDKGSRVTFINTSDPDNVLYRHALLVKPVQPAEGQADFEPIAVHAGGLAWIGNLLYVADTKNGLRVFDLDRILKLPETEPDAFGFVSESDGFRAWGYKYVVPEINNYRISESSCCVRFSFLAVDMNQGSPSLLAGEYDLETPKARLHRWPLAADENALLETNGKIVATAAFHAGVEQIQGAVTVDGNTFLSTSRFKETEPVSWGTMLVGTPGSELKETTWPWGAEDLYYNVTDDEIWSMTEHPDNRFIFAVSRQSIIDSAR